MSKEQADIAARAYEEAAQTREESARKRMESDALARRAAAVQQTAEALALRAATGSNPRKSVGSGSTTYTQIFGTD